MRWQIDILVSGEFCHPSSLITNILILRYRVQRKGVVEIIANDQGHRITPSWVSFTDEERLYVQPPSPFCCRQSKYILPSVGDAAKNAFHTNPQNTVFDAKRLIGRKMDDPDIERDVKHWPFKVKERSGKPVINVRYKGEEKEFVSLAVSTIIGNTLIS